MEAKNTAFHKVFWDFLTKMIHFILFYTYQKLSYIIAYLASWVTLEKLRALFLMTNKT